MTAVTDRDPSDRSTLSVAAGGSPIRAALSYPLGPAGRPDASLNGQPPRPPQVA
jgi:hypothetical protein